MDPIPDEVRTAACSGVWYIGNSARMLSAGTPGISSLSPSMASCAGPRVVKPIISSPASTRATFWTGPPVTSTEVGMSSVSPIIEARPDPQTK